MSVSHFRFNHDTNYVCIYIYVYMCVFILYIYIYIHMYIYICIMYIYICIMYIYIYMYYVYIYIYVLCIYIYICSLYVCVYIYIIHGNSTKYAQKTAEALYAPTCSMRLSHCWTNPRVIQASCFTDINEISQEQWAVFRTSCHPLLSSWIWLGFSIVDDKANEPGGITLCSLTNPPSCINYMNQSFMSHAWL